MELVCQDDINGTRCEVGDKTEIVSDQSKDCRIEIPRRNVDGIHIPEVSKVTVVQAHRDMIEVVWMMYLWHWCLMLNPHNRFQDQRNMMVCLWEIRKLVESLLIDNHRRTRWNKGQEKGSLQLKQIFGVSLTWTGIHYHMYRNLEEWEERFVQCSCLDNTNLLLELQPLPRLLQPAMKIKNKMYKITKYSHSSKYTELVLTYLYISPNNAFSGST